MPTNSPSNAVLKSAAEAIGRSVARFANLPVFNPKAFRGLAWPLLASAVLILQGLLVLTHEPWLDEWQALQIALQSPDLTALLENLRYEGHPPLWYLILRALGFLLPPGWVLAAAALPIAIGIQSIILFRSPFSRSERLMIACSYFVILDFATLSRSLSLGVLLLLVAFAWHNRKPAWIAIALLPLVDFLFGVMSLLLIALQAKGRRLWWPGIGLWLVCSLFSAWTVRPAPDMIPAFWLNGIVHDGMVELARYGALLLPLPIDDGKMVWNNPPPFAAALSLGLAFFVLGWRLLRRDSLSVALFFGFVALTMIFSVMVYPLAIRHLSLGALLLILLLWRQRERGGQRDPLFLSWLFLISGCGLLAAGINLVRPFDTADQAARYIAEHDLAGRHWASFPDSRAQGVSALLGMEFERLERNCTQSFVRWNYRSTINSMASLEQELSRIASRSGGFYLLSEVHLSAARTARPSHYRQLVHIRGGYDGQDFYLYRIRPDLPERPVEIPQCPPRRLPLRVMR